MTVETGRDAAPGDTGAMDAERESVSEGVLTYLIGLALSALLTAAAFYFAQSHWIWGPSIPVALSVLAIAQIGVHLVFFLHLTTAPDNVNNTLALAFGTLIVALVIGGTLWIMYHMNMNMPPMERMPTPLAAVAHYRTATGVVEAASPAPVEAQVAGRIQSAECEAGTRVKKGQPCATIDAPSLGHSVLESERRLRAAQARLDQDQAALASAQASLNRSEALSPRRAAGLKKIAEAAQKRLDQDSSKVSELEHALEVATAKLADTRILAPIDGVVLTRNVEPGQTVAPTTRRPLFVFAPDAVEIKASVSGPIAAALKAGEKIAFAVDQLQGRSFDGEIIRVAPGHGAEPAEVVVLAPDPHAALKPGMRATIKLPAE